MAGDHTDAIRYEEQYVRDVIFYLADDGSDSRQDFDTFTGPPEISPPEISDNLAEPVVNPAEFPPGDTFDKEGHGGQNRPEEAQQQQMHPELRDAAPDGSTILLCTTATTATTRKDRNSEDQTATMAAKSEQHSQQQSNAAPNTDQTSVNPRRTEQEIMDIFNEQERQFTEEILSPRCLSPTVDVKQRPRVRSKTQSHSRSPCCTPAYVGVGLEHLDNLVRLLEQLNELKTQNKTLRKKCHYLENTKSLLQVHNNMLNAVTMHRTSSPKVRGRSKSTKHSSRSKVFEHQQRSDGVLLGHRYVSDSSDDEANIESRKLNKLGQRSQSVGSINVDMDAELNTHHTTRHHHILTKRSSSKHGKDINRFESMFSRSKFSSKWERVKKVFSGKPETPPKSDPTTITAEQLVRANSKYVRAPSSLPQMIPGAAAQHAEERNDRTSTSPTSPSYEPSSPVSVESEPVIPSVIADDQDLYGEDIMVAGGVDSVVDVDTLGGLTSYTISGGHSPSITGDEMDLVRITHSSPSPTTPSSAPIQLDGAEQSNSNFLTVKQTPLQRRQSSPTLCMSDTGSDAGSSGIGTDSLELPRLPTIKRSSSFKITKSTDNIAGDVSDDGSSTRSKPSGGTSSSTTDGSSSSSSTRGKHHHHHHHHYHHHHGGHRSAWGRVKDIIHTRKDSLKRKNKRSNSAGDMLPDGSVAGTAVTGEDGIYEYCSKSDVEETSYEIEAEPTSATPRSASPRLARKDSMGKSHQTSPRVSPNRQRRAGSSPPTRSLAKKHEQLKSPSGSPPPHPVTKSDSMVPARGSTSPGPLDVSALMGCMSDEFNKKMQEWEEKKHTRRSLFKDNSINLEDAAEAAAAVRAASAGDAARFTEEFIRKMEQWEKMKGLGSPPKSRAGGQSQSPDVCTPPEQQAAVAPSMEELQKHLSESFSKTVQEWEKIKTQRIKETGSPIPDPHQHQSGPTAGPTKHSAFDKRSRKTERSKSRERDRSRSKYDKQRERERQKIEKKEQKIEKERQKLEKMRLKLEGIETIETYAEGVSQEFAHKLYEWEVMKGLRQEHSVTTTTTAVSTTDDTPSGNMPANGEGKKQSPDSLTQTTHTRSQSAKAYKEYFSEKRERTQSESKVDDLGMGNATLGERRKSEVGNAGRSASVPSIRASTRQLVDDSTSIDLNLTSQEPSSGRSTLEAEIEAKEEELLAMQHEVQQLTERISEMDIYHNATIGKYKRELWASSEVGRYTIETDLVQASIHELRQKVDHLTAYQGKLINERNQLQHQLELELRTRQQVEARLITQVRASPTKSSHQQAVESVKDFDKLCEFFLKLWSQLNELRLGILERNKLLADMQQHVLQQEIGNRLLAADMASRDLQLAYLQGARRRRVLRRSHSFAGRDHVTRANGDTKVWSKQHQAANYHAIFRRAIEQLRHGDIEATPVDWEWLERLRAQRASAIGQLKCAAVMANQEAQTDPIPPTPTDRTLTNASPPTSMQLAAPPIVMMENKSIQAAVMEDVGLPPRSPSQPKSPTSPPYSSQQKPAPHKLQRPQLVRQHHMAESSPLCTPPYVESPTYNTQGTSGIGTAINPANIAGAGSSGTSSGGSNSAEAVFTFNVSDPATAGLIEVTGVRLVEPPTTTATSPQQDAIAEGTAAAPPSEKQPQQQQVTVAPSSGTHTQRVHDEQEDGTGPWVMRSCCSSNSSEEPVDPQEPLSPSLYPPPSPIIRSRNTRKLKADLKAAQLYSTDARTWKATPPKRVRHRRTSADRRPDSLSGADGDQNGGEDGSDITTDTQTSAVRGRRSERFSIQQPRSLSVPPRDSVMYDLCFRDRGNTHSGGATNRDVAKLKHHHGAGSSVPPEVAAVKYESGTGIVATMSGSPQISCCRGNRSPSPAIRKPLVTPVHRLKTAAELMMEDSQYAGNSYRYQHQHRGWRSHSQTRASSLSPLPLPSLASDKEKDLSEKLCTIELHSKPQTGEGAKVKGTAGGRPISPTGELIRQTVRRLSESSCDVKPVLDDLTNGSRSLNIPDSFGDRRWTTDSTVTPRPRTTRSKSDVEGQESRIEKQEVAVVMQTPFQGVKAPPLSAMSDSPLCDSIKSLDLGNDKKITDSPSPTPGGRPRSRSTLERIQQRSPSSSLSGSARDLKAKLFGRKTNKVGGSTGTLNTKATGSSGVLTVLCKQALSVDVSSSAKETTDGATGGGDTKQQQEESSGGTGSRSATLEKTKTKRGFFADTNWLQKPKRFFKVSK